MFMSDFVDWVIPDIPKDISQQIHKEKVLMVELFMREEQGKQQLLEPDTSFDLVFKLPSARYQTTELKREKRMKGLHQYINHVRDKRILETPQTSTGESACTLRGWVERQ